LNHFPHACFQNQIFSNSFPDGGQESFINVSEYIFSAELRLESSSTMTLFTNRTHMAPGRGGARHFHLGGPLEGPVLQQGELSMFCVRLSERDLLQWHDVTRKILGGPGKILGEQWTP